MSGPHGRYARAARLAAPAVTQVTDRFHLVQNLRETIERELALHRAYLRVRVTVNGRPDHPPLVPSIDRPVGSPVARERRLLPARRLALQTEIRRQLRQTHQQLFDAFKTMQATGVSISAIAQQLGCNRRRLDKWAKQTQLPVRQKMHPSPGSAETFREFLRQRWDAGCRNGQALVDELRAQGYQGTYKAVGKILSPWRVGNVTFERGAEALTMPAPPSPVLTDPTERQISPQIAATLLTTPRPELTAGNAQIVDALKVGCPGYAVMRSLMMGFRALVKQSPSTPAPTTRPVRTVTALHQWMARARASGFALIPLPVESSRSDPMPTTRRTSVLVTAAAVRFSVRKMVPSLTVKPMRSRVVGQFEMLRAKTPAGADQRADQRTEEWEKGESYLAPE